MRVQRWQRAKDLVLFFLPNLDAHHDHTGFHPDPPTQAREERGIMRADLASPSDTVLGSSAASGQVGGASTPGPSSAQTIQVPGFRDATEIFRNACTALRQGQMVHVKGFTMMDSMGAIQIMDRRMDSGMAAPLQDTPEDDRLTAEEAAALPPFDPDADLSIDEVCWVIDRLVACETCWQSGSALSQTIHTCLYVHNPDFLYCGRGDQFADEDRPDTLASTVLRAYLAALLKCCCLAWDELSKGNVLDGEDWTGDKSGCSLLEDLDPVDVLSLLEESILMIRRKEGCFAGLSDANVEALATRLQFRKHLLMSMMVLQDPYLAGLDELQMHAHFLKTSIIGLIPDQAQQQQLQAHGPLRLRTPPLPAFSHTGRVHAPSLRIKSSFDPAYSRKLTSVVPLRPINLPSAKEVRTFWTTWAEGLQMVLQFGKAPTVGLGWTQWQNFLRLRASRFRISHPPPYLRSVLQSIICNQNHLVAGRFPPVWHAHAFLRELAAIDAQEISDAVSIQAHARHPPPPHHQDENLAGRQGASWQTMAVRQKTLPQALDSFYGRLGGNLASYLAILCQNRPRQKRSLAKACRQWANLAEEAQELESRLTDEVRLDIPTDVHYAAIQHLSLDIMLDIFFSGFELDLYRPDEWASLYWLASEVAREQSQLCEEFAEVIAEQALDEDGSLGFEGQDSQHGRTAARASTALLKHRALHADMLAKLCEAQFCFLLLLIPEPPPKPDAGSQESQDGTKAKAAAASLAVFSRRLKWIEPHPRPRNKAGMFWHKCSSEREAMSHVEPVELARKAQRLFAEAQNRIAELSRSSRADARTELCDAMYKETLAQLKSVTVRNSQSLAARAEGRTDVAQTADMRAKDSRRSDWTFEEHPWFGSLL
ncbi:N-alpha-acetyltransferase, non-catalitic subunit [Tilletia horrida]|uniref:N-alpha-acetyltransferase, non-catalitic subunit n=1 Tax=Tilletia horrida TaxID=155126 RepID=A0AAN6G9G7_9BASI|nr:N-alpha-acetyltransferase, non-catalitic subunit [Tilletia horrida]